MVPLENAEGLYVVEPVNHVTPETLSERRWAFTVVDCLLTDLRAQWTAQGRASEFDELKSCLLGQAPVGTTPPWPPASGRRRARSIVSDAGFNPCCASASRKPLPMDGTLTTRSVI